MEKSTREIVATVVGEEGKIEAGWEKLTCVRVRAWRVCQLDARLGREQGCEEGIHGMLWRERHAVGARVGVCTLWKATTFGQDDEVSYMAYSSGELQPV